MKKNFWFIFSFAFVFIFPLVFFFIGFLRHGQWMSLISFIIGLLLWFLFLRVLHRTQIAEPEMPIHEADQMQAKGHPTTAKVEAIRKVKDKHGSKPLDLLASFKNYAGTIAYDDITLIDTTPQRQRFELGKTFPICLSTSDKPQVAWVAQDVENDAMVPLRRWMIPFTILYAFLTFLFLTY